jgi:DNA-directed RNA polymerase subunit RPC12/RpoP
VKKMVYKCGQKPGVGRYVCLGCGEDLKLDDGTDTLPPCAKCNKCEFKRD